MPFDANDEETKSAIEAAVAKAVEPLAAKNKQLLGELKTAKKGTEIDPADFERLETERDELAAKLKESDKAIKAAQKLAEDTGKTLVGEQAALQALLVDAGLVTALTEAGVKNPAHLKAAKALLKAEGKIEVKADAEGNRVALVGDKPLKDFVTTWAGSDDGKAFVSAPQNGGGAAQGGGGGGGGGQGNMGGTLAERQQAIAAKFPELPLK